MRLLIVNQYFPPDRAATGILLGQLARDLAEHHDVTVVCGRPTYDPEPEALSAGARSQVAGAPEPCDRLRRIEVPLFRFSRERLALRILNYVLFFFGALWRTLTLSRHDAVMAWTDPPLIGLVGAAFRFARGARFIFVSQDLYPEVALAVGKMNDPLSRTLLRLASSLILRWADTVVAVGHDMRKRLFAKGCPAHKVVVIPNWQDLHALRPGRPERFRRENAIPPDAFVVMHSGNIGLSQDFETLLGAAALTRGDPGILYLIAGSGSRKEEIEKTVREKNLNNVRFLPYQPGGALSDALSAADLHYVSLRPELTGCIVPSKLYGILAVGRPVIANVAAESDPARIVREAGAGTLVPPDASAVAEAIREAAKYPEKLRRAGLSGRSWAEAHGGRDRAAAAYRQVIEAGRPVDGLGSPPERPATPELAPGRASSEPAGRTGA